MTDSAQSRPRPKPRPRPRPVAAKSSVSGDASGSSVTAPIGEIVVNDSDDPFVVNRGRTRETWKKLDEINEDASGAVSSDESGGSHPSTPLRKRPKNDGTPQWRNDQDRLRSLLTAEESDDSDSDIEVLGSITGGKGTDGGTPNKRKRVGRQKSRSITPPPALPAAVLANARNIIRQALDAKQHRAPSPTAFDDFDNSTDTIVLDPELERIAKAVNTQPTQNSSIPNLSGDNEERIVIHVQWQSHPLDPLPKELEWSYRMRVDEPFRELFDTVAEDAQVLVPNLILSYNNKRIFPSTRPDSLRLWGEVQLTACQQKTYDYMQQQAREVRQTQSPARGKATHSFNPSAEDVINIGSDDEDEGDFEITTTYAPPSNYADTHIDSRPSKPSQEGSDVESEADTGKFKLVFRSNKISKDITLIVRPTTKCGAIIKAYIKKAGLEKQYPHIFDEAVATEAPEPQSRGRGRGRGRGKGKGKGRGRGSGKAQAPPPAPAPDLSNLPDPRICVDGDKMDNTTEIGEAELDDGDMVDVVGL